MTAVLREMRWWDIDAVLDLERALFPDDAWSRGMFWSELAHSRGPGATRWYVVAEDGDRLVGYAGLAAAGGEDTTGGQDTEPGMGAVGDVQTIAVSRDHWGTGLGALLLADLLKHASAFECQEVMLEVRVDNVRAQKLYERFGFAPIGRRRGYYQPGNIDALVMRMAMNGDGPPCDPVAPLEPADPVAPRGADARGENPDDPGAPAGGDGIQQAEHGGEGTRTHG